MSKQPRDDGNDVIPVLGLRPNGGQKIVLTAVESQRSTAFGASVRVITVYSTKNCYIEIGDSNVVAITSNSHFLPAGIMCDFSLGYDTVAANNNKYLAVYSTDTGTLYISERV